MLLTAGSRGPLTIRSKRKPPDPDLTHTHTLNQVHPRSVRGFYAATSSVFPTPCVDPCAARRSLRSVTRSSHGRTRRNGGSRSLPAPVRVHRDTGQEINTTPRGRYQESDAALYAPINFTVAAVMYINPPAALRRVCVSLLLLLPHPEVTTGRK